MQLRVIASGQWQVIAPIDDHGVCEVLDELARLSGAKITRATAAGFLSLLDRIPAEGPRRLGTPLYHCVDDNEQIYEFIKGSHRLLCFQEDGRVVLCSHIFRKTSKKTPVSEKQKAIRVREEYRLATLRGTIEILNGEEPE